MLEVFSTRRQDRNAALSFLKQAMIRHGRPRMLAAGRLRSYSAAIKTFGLRRATRVGAGSTAGQRTRINYFDDEKVRWHGSKISRLCRNSPRRAARSTTISTMIAISIVATSSSRTDPSPSPSGVFWRAECLRSSCLAGQVKFI